MVTIATRCQAKLSSQSLVSPRDDLTIDTKRICLQPTGNDSNFEWKTTLNYPASRGPSIFSYLGRSKGLCSQQEPMGSCSQGNLKYAKFKTLQAEHCTEFQWKVLLKPFGS